MILSHNAAIYSRIQSQARQHLGRFAGESGRIKDDLEKYEHLEELAERFFAAKRRHPQALAASARATVHTAELRMNCRC